MLCNLIRYFIGVRWRCVVCFMLRPLYLRVEKSQYLSIRDWVAALRACLDVVAKRNILAPVGVGN